MKKFVALLIVLCVVFGLCIGYRAVPINGVALTDDAAELDAAAPAEDNAAPAEALPGIDAEAEAEAETQEDNTAAEYAALYAIHEPDYVVASIDGRDVTWADYYYFLHFQAQQMSNYFAQMANYYEMDVGWQDEYETGLSFEDFAVDNTESMLRELYGIEKYAAEHDNELDAEDEETLQAQRESDIVSVCGEGATEEDFAEALKLMYISDELYTRLNACNILYIEGFEREYGAQGELMDEAEAVRFLEDNGYLAANHILFLTTDSETGEELSEEEIAEKRAQAEELVEELRAIDDVDARLARFAELKSEYDEDTGKTGYPEGYVFTEGTMVSEFEDAVKALGDYEVSDPVLSNYGYHVIMRLPHGAGRTVQYLNNGTPVDARYLSASSKYTNDMQSLYKSLDIDYAEDFEQIKLSEYVK